MKKNLLTIVIVLLTLNFSCKCSGANVFSRTQEKDLNRTISKINYDSTILVIETHTKGMITWDELFNIKEFIDVYENGMVYIDSALAFLRNSKFTDNQKKICINTMQRTSLENYVKICYECKRLYDNGIMNEKILEWAIAPNFSNRYLVVRNYEDPLISALLKKLKEDNKITEEFKNYLDEISSGKAWKNIKQIDGESR